MPTLQEIKDYLGIDGDYNDPLISSLLNAARELVEGILRYQIAKINPVPSLVTEAIKFTVAFLYSGRETADIKALEKTLRTMLNHYRQVGF